MGPFDRRSPSKLAIIVSYSKVQELYLPGIWFLTSRCYMPHSSRNYGLIRDRSINRLDRAIWRLGIIFVGLCWSSYLYKWARFNGRIRRQHWSIYSCDSVRNVGKSKPKLDYANRPFEEQSQSNKDFMNFSALHAFYNRFCNYGCLANF